MYKDKSNKKGIQNKSESLHVQISDTGSDLTKDQLNFNRLTLRINKLKAKILADNEKLDALNKDFTTNVFPELIKAAEEKLKIAHIIDSKITLTRLPKKMNLALHDLIIQSLDDAFELIDADPKDEKLYRKYNGRSRAAAQKEEMDDFVDFYSKMFYESTGFKFNPDDLKDKNPDYDKIRQEYENFMDEREKENPVKKSKKRTEKDLLLAQKEKLKGQSLRSIYLTLAKILHPDTETDEKIKADKEEYMKLVTQAYESKNLMELLNLQLTWVSQHSFSFQNTPADVLRSFNLLLNDQIKELEQESRTVLYNQRYDRVRRYFVMKDSLANMSMKLDQRRAIKTQKVIQQLILSLETEDNVKEALKHCVEKLLIVD